MQGLGLLLVLAVLVIYIVLGILYESFIHPLTILSGLPSAGFGALITLWIFGKELDIYGFVGIIMLVGIVKKNAIMMIDFALEAQRDQGLTPSQAIFEGCLVVITSYSIHYTKLYEPSPPGAAPPGRSRSS